MKNHIILCGLGKVGFSILEALRSLEETVVVITKEVNPGWARRAERLAERLILADARDEKVLIEAGIEQARALILATHDDLTNLSLALEARRLAPQTPVVLRLFDLQLAEQARRSLNVRAVLNAAALSASAFVAAALGEEVRGAFQIESAHLNLITLKITAESGLAGETLRGLAERCRVNPLAVQTEEGALMLAPSLDRALALGEEVVVATSRTAVDLSKPETGCSQRGETGAPPRRPCRRKHVLAEFLLRRINAFVRASPQIQAIRVAVISLAMMGMLVFHTSPMGLGWLDAFYFTVTIMSTVGFGDIHLLAQSPWLKLFGCLLMVSGPALVMVYFSLLTDYLVSRRFAEALRRPRKAPTDHVVVVGLGNLGYHVAMRLHELGEAIMVVERDRENDFVALLPDEIPVLFGDAHQPQRMQEAGFERARAVLALTGEDLVNLRIAQRAKEVNPRVKTVVRLFDSTLADRLDSSLFGVDLALNPSQAAAATFAAAALAPDVLHGLRLDGRLLMLRRAEARQRAEWVGRSVGDLRENLDVLTLLRKSSKDAHLREVSRLDRVQAGDHLIVLEEHSPVLPVAPVSISIGGVRGLLVRG